MQEIWQKKLSYGERLSWFKNLVANKQPWDLKQTLKGHYKFMGKIVTGADLGNIHYGFVGTAVGFSETVLLLGAGYAQLRAGTSSWKFVFSNFDDPWDQKMISCGIKLYNPIMNHSIKAI